MLGGAGCGWQARPADVVFARRWLSVQLTVFFHRMSKHMADAILAGVESEFCRSGTVQNR